MVHLRRAAVLLVVAALVLAVGGSLASAKKHKKKHKPVTSWDSQITLSLTTPTHFEGTVSSKLDACRNQRYLILYYADPDTGNVLPLSVQRTDGAGRYQVDLPKPAYPGGYDAQVAEERIRANKAPQLCKGASSPPVTVSG
jgi:hypothetical protein